MVVLFWFMLLFLICFPLWMISGALADAQYQHYVTTRYQKVPATVSASEVKSWRSDHETHYAPEVKYQYEVGGKMYESDRIAPLTVSGSEEWANSIVTRYRAGEPCDAFYDPANPNQAVLLRGYIFRPYKELLQCAFILSSGSFILITLWFGKKPKLSPADNGWFAIAPESGERQRLLSAKAASIVWYAVAAVAAAHYFLVVPPPHEHTGTFKFFFALGLIPLGMWVRYSWMNRNMDEAQFLVDRAEGILGGALRCSLTQTMRRQLQLKQASLKLVCLGIKKQGKSSSSTVLFETIPAEVKDTTVHVGEDLKLAGEVIIPATQQPSGRDASGKYDWIRWKMRFRCEVARAPDYSAEYRLEVKPPTIEEPAPLVKPRVSVDAGAVEPEFAGRIMSKSHLLVGTLLTFIPIVIQLAGIGLCVAVFLVLFPDKEHTAPFWNLPKPEAQQVFAAGAALVILGTVWGFGFAGRLANRYMRAVAKHQVKRRPNAIVQPDADSLFVEIIPRKNWNRMMWRNHTDTGLLTVDTARREIRYEGDRQRFCVPADALLSCNVEKSLLSATARPNAPGIFLVVLRAADDPSVWETPIAPVVPRSILNSKARQRAADALQKRILALRPATVIAQSSAR